MSLYFSPINIEAHINTTNIETPKNIVFFQKIDLFFSLKRKKTPANVSNSIPSILNKRERPPNIPARQTYDRLFLKIALKSI